MYQLLFSFLFLIELRMSLSTCVSVFSPIDFGPYYESVRYWLCHHKSNHLVSIFGQLQFTLKWNVSLRLNQPSWPRQWSVQKKSLIHGASTGYTSSWILRNHSGFNMMESNSRVTASICLPSHPWLDSNILVEFGWWGGRGSVLIGYYAHGDSA